MGRSEFDYMKLVENMDNQKLDFIVNGCRYVG